MYSGQCLCGDLKINISNEPLAAALCHCLDCRRTSGSAFGLNWVVYRTDFKLVAGKPQTYTIEAASGNPVTAHFCDRCGSTLWREGPATGEVVYVKAGTTDQQDAVEGLRPKAEIFTRGGSVG